MKLKKTVAIAAAAGALAAISVPAMAMENEFHGMYRLFAYMTNATSGAGKFNLAEKSSTDKYIEQRARLQYTAKASADLKLVTHFELDTKFGGSSYVQGATNKYPLGDAGGLDADRITLETKNVYLDFNCPLTGANVKAGIQPFGDKLAGTFGNFDATGIMISKKFNNITGKYGYFTTTSTAATAVTFPSVRSNTDLNVLDLSVALNKDMTVGTSFYNQLFKSGSETYGNNTFGVNAKAKMGPASLAATLGYQFGKQFNTINGTSALSASLAAKVAAGPGNVNASFLYLSGDRNGTGYNHGWQSVAGNAGVNYFTPANMWLLTRNAATINSSTAVTGTSDLTLGGKGIMGVFAGYDGTAGKVFYDANVGYGKAADKRAANSASIGTELNATVGYKMYDALKVSFTAAYLILGDGMNKDEAGAAYLSTNAVRKADNPFLTNIALNYTF